MQFWYHINAHKGKQDDAWCSPPICLSFGFIATCFYLHEERKCSILWCYFRFAELHLQSHKYTYKGEDKSCENDVTAGEDNIFKINYTKTREAFLLCPSCAGSFKSHECSKSTYMRERQLFFNQLSEEDREADNVCMEILSPHSARRFYSEI